MTERLYYTDSSLLEFDAAITGVEEIGTARYAILLDRSAFYPTSGGQLHDIGELSGVPVVEVVEDNSRIWHILDRKPPFGPGDTVAGKIDRLRRRDNMQKHTGQHILSQAFVRICGAETVSSRLGESDSTVDLSIPDVTDDQIIAAEDLANQIIFENRPVTVSFVPFDDLAQIPLRKIPPRGDGDFRVVTIKDFDWSACGGTHCAAAGAVGIIKITTREKIRGTLRLHFLTGHQAVADYRWRFEQIEGISNIFTRHARESLDAVRQMIDEMDVLRRKNADLHKQLLPVLIDKWHTEAVVIAGHRVIALDLSDQDMKAAKQTAVSIINAHDDIALIGLDDKLMVAVPGDSHSAADILKRAAERFGGRGGGSPQLAQGGGFKPEDVKYILSHPEAILHE